MLSSHSVAAVAAMAVRHDRALGAYKAYKFVQSSDANGTIGLGQNGSTVNEREFESDPVLMAAEREILSTTAARAREEVKRAELLMHGREFDAMLAKLGSESIAATRFGSGSDDDDKASTQSASHFYGGASLNVPRSYTPFLDLGIDDAHDNLLCDFGAPIIDGAIGLINDEGAEIFVVSNAPPMSSWMSNGNLCSLVAPEGHVPEWAGHGGYQQMPDVVGFGVPGHTDDDETIGSAETLTSLRARYRTLFGKDTNSNNRQWIARRLDAFINGEVVSPLERSRRDESPDSGEGTVLQLRQTQHFEPPSPTSKRAAGKRQVKSLRSYEEVEVMESPMRGGRVVQAKGRMVVAGAVGKRKRGVNEVAAALPKSLHKKTKSVSDAESNDGDGVKKMMSSRSAAQKSLSRSKVAGDNGSGRRSKHHNPWALEEAEALVRGVAQCGGGKWADIKKLGFPAIEHRTAVDLKDKWRNLLRIAMLPQQSVKTAGDKKREIPQDLLAKVRDLAAKQAKLKATVGGR